MLMVGSSTVSMMFEVNSSPLAGKEGKFVTSRQIRERLLREALHNVALKVEEGDDADKFRVSGRGELHLSVLLENMRREGYEVAVARPQVIIREVDGVKQEPYEAVAVDIEERHQGAIMEALGGRGGELRDMRPDGRGRVRIDYRMPARGLIGFQTLFRTLTSGSGLLYHVFEDYGPVRNAGAGQRANGALISNGDGEAVGYSLFNLQERGRLMVGPGDAVYEGMVVGIHARDNDLTVNPLKAKALTNIRAAGKDENVLLTPALRMTLEQALEFIDDDELVEVTPQSIRVRKRFLKEHERRKAAREAS
jgi:GTP-binding protein